jgi:hypothetical protein
MDQNPNSQNPIPQDQRQPLEQLLELEAPEKTVQERTADIQAKIAKLPERQLAVLRWLRDNPEYEEKPVSIREFIDSLEYLGAAEECWPLIKDDLEALFEGYDNPDMEWKYEEAVFDEGIGAGKSYKCSLIITYLLYRTLIIRDPQRFLGRARGSGLYFINMSVRAEQAKKIVFGEIVQRVQNSKWFRDHGYLPNENVRSELQFPKNIFVIPGNSRETFPLGFTLLGAVMDEAAFYIDIEDHDVAEEIYNALHSRIKSRFANTGMTIMISSPRYVEDFIERKFAEAKINSRIFSRRRTSWEAQPKGGGRGQLSGKMINIQGYDIPVEYEQNALRNFDRFKRDHMAIPSLVLEPYFKAFELVEACIDSTMPDPVYRNTFTEDFRGKPQYGYTIHIDLSLTTDSTGIAMCHREGDDVFLDLVIKIKPPEDGEIDLKAIRAIVLELKARGFGITKCTYDQYQSAESIQELNKNGIMAEKFSVDKDMAAYETLKELFYIHKLHMYKHPELLGELKRLEMINGKKVDHPKGGSKDCADAVAGCVYSCVANTNNFGFGFAGGTGIRGSDNPSERDSRQNEPAPETLTQDGLVPYGYFAGRRRG